MVTEQGVPIADATVYLMRNGRSPSTVTDANGKFYFTDVPVGGQKIIAYKESDNFPNILWSFYSDAYGTSGLQIVNVSESKTVQDVVVTLGPKAGRLMITVIDAQTKNHIRNANAILSIKGKPKTLLQTGTNGPEGFDVLIPPSVAINVEVTAPGYQTWHYKTPDSDAVRLNSGSEQKITVELYRGLPSQ